MCTLIYATVPKKTDPSKLPTGPVKLVAFTDPEVSSRLPPDEQLCRVTGVPECAGGGHCGTVLGREALPRGEAAKQRDLAQLKKLRKKGWSEHKVQAWLKQRVAGRRHEPAHLNAGVDELALWRAFLETALGEGKVPFVGLMVYTSGDEPELPVRTQDLALTRCDLTHLEQGVLYRVRA